MGIGLTIFFAAVGQILDGGRAGWAKGIVYGWLLVFLLLFLLAALDQ